VSIKDGSDQRLTAYIPLRHAQRGGSDLAGPFDEEGESEFRGEEAGDDAGEICSHFEEEGVAEEAGAVEGHFGWSGGFGRVFVLWLGDGFKR